MRPELRITYVIAALLSGQAAGQDYPSRPLRIVVPTQPGSGGDVTARVMAPEMSKLLGQPIVVENKVGAGNFRPPDIG